MSTAAVAGESTGDSLRPARHVRVAHALTAVALMLPAITVVLHLANAQTPVDTWWGGFVLIGAGLGAMGGLLASRMPDNPIGWIFLTGSLGQGLAGAGREWAVFGYATHPGSLPFVDWAAWLGCASTVALASLPLALIRLPDGRLPGRFEHITQWAVVSVSAFSIVLTAVEPGDYTEQMPGLGSPLQWRVDWLPAAETAAWMGVSATVVLGAISLVLRWWRSDGGERRALRWVVLAAAVLTVELVLENSPLAVSSMFDWLGPLVFVAFVGTVTVSVLRFQLWDTDVLVDISLGYAIATAVIGGAFVTLTAIAGKVFDQRDIVWPALVALAVFALAFVPLRNRVRGWIEHARSGRHSDPYLALDTLSRQSASPEASALLPEAIRLAVAESPLVDYLSVIPVGGTPVSWGASHGERVRDALTFDGRRVGAIEVGYRPGTLPSKQAEERLARLRDRMAAVVHAAGIESAVAESRRAVAVAREEERRRLRRDLHDGLGPALAAIALRIDGARTLMARDPARADAVLGGASDDVRATIADIRRLVYDLQPPVLDAMGLLPALRELASSFTVPGVGGDAFKVRVDGDGELPALSAAVEIAAYRIVCEALTNVSRHAEARCCDIAVAIDGRDLTIVVSDDGNGRAPGQRAGVGTASMIERATELGGTCRIGRSASGGTRVAVRLPVPQGALSSGRTSRAAASPMGVSA